MMTPVTRRHRMWRVTGALLAVALLALGGMYLYAVRDHDPAHPYSRPYGFRMTHTVSVKAAPLAVSTFISYDKPDLYRRLAGAHDSLTFIRGDALVEGAVFETREFQADEGVINRYTLTQVVPGRHFEFVSRPSLIYGLRDGQWVETGRCNAYSWYDIEPEGSGSRVTQTIVIEMHGFLTKFLIDMVILGQERNEWQEHLVEELEALKAAIEAKG